MVDAVLGYGNHDAPTGEAERLIGFSVRAARPVVSLDLPSGVDPDTGEAAGIAITATATLTLALPKPGLFRGAGPDRAGRVYLGDIGLPEAGYAALGISAGHPFSAGRIVLLVRTT